jgi:hypothetical protein
MAHPLTHLTHGIPTRRPFHPAKTASILKALQNKYRIKYWSEENDKIVEVGRGTWWLNQPGRQQ